MTAQLFDQPTIVRLQVVIETIRSGKLLLPDFQRPFVWNNNQRFRLFDSIVKGLPIGSLMIWRTTQSVAIKRELDGIALPAPAKETTFSYLLDGQQRMFTLSAVLSNKRVVAFQKTLWATGLEEHNLLAERAEEVANIIRDYPLALVPLVVEDLGLVTQSFQRVNSAGSPMSEAHMLRALTYDGTFDLAVRFDQIVADSAWVVLDHQILVNVIKAIAGVSIYGTEMAAVTDALRSKEAGAKLLEKAERGTIAAIAFLNDTLQIRAQEALPYAFQLVALAAAAAEGADLEATGTALARWFWATTYTEYFTGQTAGQLRNAFEHVRAVCNGTDPLAELTTTCALSARFQSTSVRSLALMHLLATQSLTDPDNHRVDGPALLARGSAVFIQLYPRTPASDLANRILVAPEQAVETRRALLDFTNPAFDELRTAHQFPLTSTLIGAPLDAILSRRRDQLLALEQAKIESLGLTVRHDT